MMAICDPVVMAVESMCCVYTCMGETSNLLCFVSEISQSSLSGCSY